MPEDTAPQFKVLVDGSELATEVAVDVLSVTVCQYTEGADMFTIELNNRNSEQQEYKWADSDEFDLGSEVEIKTGYMDHLATLIKGEITAVEPEFVAGEAAAVKVQGYDRLHRFRRDRKTRSFIEMKDSQVAEQMAQELQLQSQVEDTEVVHPYLFQNNQTNIDFLQERARRIRYEVDVESKTLIFRPAANDSGKSITLRFGEKLQAFRPRLTTLGQVSKVIVQGWNPKTKEAIVGRAGAGDEISKMEGDTIGAALTESAFGETKTYVVDKYLFSQTEAEQIAKAKYNDMIVDFITGEGTTIGVPELRAGDVIELSGLGSRFSGLYYATAVSHVVNPEGYLTHFSVKRNAL